MWEPDNNVINSSYLFTLNIYSTIKSVYIFTTLEDFLFVVFTCVYFNLKARANLFCTGFLCFDRINCVGGGGMT